MAQRLLENTLDRTARIISQRTGVSVVFRGDEVPHTDGKTITLPSLPTPCSPQIERVMNGLLDHEMGHVLFSDFASVVEFKRQHGEHHFQVLNILEDLRVEKLIESEYPGATNNLCDAYTDMQRQWDAAMPSMPLWIRLGGCLFAEGKGWDTARYGPDACRIVRTVADLVHQAVDAPSTGHVATLAVSLMQRLKARTESQPDPNAANRKCQAVQTRERDALAVALSTAPDQNSMTLATLLGESIKEAYTAANRLAYRVHDRSQDEIITAPDMGIESYNWLMETVRPHVSGMRQKLISTMRSHSQGRLIPNETGNILNQKKLHNLVLDVPCQPCLKRSVVQSTNVAVSLLVDQSGSMQGEKIHIARQCAVLLAETLDQLGIDCEVLGCTTSHDRSYLAQFRTGDTPSITEIEAQFARYLPTLHLIYKAFGELQRKCRGRYASMSARHYTPLNESVLLAGKRLLGQKASRHLLIVLTDGQCFLGCKATQPVVQSNLRDNLELLRKARIETFGIGIRSPYVREIFHSAVVVDAVADLPQQFFTAISNRLLR